MRTRDHSDLGDNHIDASMMKFSGLVFAAALLFTIGGIFMKLSDGVTRLGPSLAMAVCFVAGAVV